MILTPPFSPHRRKGRRSEEKRSVGNEDLSWIKTPAFPPNSTKPISMKRPGRATQGSVPGGEVRAPARVCALPRRGGPGKNTGRS